TGTGLSGGILAVENVTGGAGDDALTGDTGNNSLKGLAGDDTLADGGGDDTLDGGVDNDTYLLTPGSADLLTDAMGTDVLDFSGASAGVTINLDDATAQDVFGGHLVTLNGTFEDFAGSAFDDAVTAGDAVPRNIAGGGGSDTFNTAANGMNVWAISASDAGSVADAAQTVSFSSVENLSGGTGDDSFDFDDGFLISGTINGGSGSDTLDYTAYSAGNSVSLSLAGTVGVENAIGGDGSDTILADNTATLFDVTGMNAGDVGALGFVDFENLTGGSADDTFQFGSGGVLSGGINGGAAASANAVVLSTDDDHVTLSSLSATTGFSGSLLDESMLSVSTFANINSVAAGAVGTDTFNGLDATSAWTLNDGSSDLYQSGSRSLSIDEFESYTGGNGADVFTLNGSQAVSLDGADGDDQFSFASGAAQTTQIQGGTGTDTIQFAGPAAEMITLSAVGTSGFSGVTANVNVFRNTDAVIGTGADTLIGVAGTAAAFDLSTLGNTYQAGGQTLAFSGVSQLVGADQADTFSVTGAHTVDISAGDGDDQILLLTNSSDITGSIDGGAGANDVFDLSSLSAGRMVDSSGLTNVESLIGTTGNDTLIGSTTGSVFQVTGMSNAGVLDGTLNFSSVETLQGGAGNDSFSLDDLLTIGAVTGSTGDDTLSFAGYNTARSVQLTTVVAGSGYTGSEASVSAFTGINTITASGQSSDELIGLNSNSTFGLDGTPTYVSGTETLNLGAFEIFTGNVGQDAFQVSGTQTVTANGGGGSDTLVLADAAVLNGVFTGGSGTDTIDFSAYSSPLTMTLPGLGATDGFQVTAAGVLGMAASDVNAISGGTGFDNITGQATDSTWTIGATDTYTTAGRSLTLDEVEVRLGSSGVDTFTIQGDALDVA
ncbi:MAG: hypothetical protein VB858_10695, partial [Planctomycetaceae bacterium]